MRSPVGNEHRMPWRRAASAAGALVTLWVAAGLPHPGATAAAEEGGTSVQSSVPVTILVHTALVGSSLGGLVSLYAGVTAWQTFGLIGGVSPVVEWGDHDLEKRYQKAPAAQLPLRIWIDMGSAEDAADVGPDSRHIRELRRFRTVLESRGYTVGETLGYQEDAGAPHNEAAWAKRLPDILRFLLPSQR